MITLTNPIAVTTILGSAGKTNYDRLDLLSINYDVANKNLQGQCALIASGSPQATPIPGAFNIPTTGSAILTLSIPTLPFYASLALTSGQQAAVQGWITAAQNQVEAGLVSVAVVTGTQSPGS